MKEELLMSRFGIFLTGRMDGKNAYEEIKQLDSKPSLLNFENVMSLGSSFGDEVLVPLAQQNSNTIYIKNANPVIKQCISLIEEDSNIKVKYVK